MTQIKLSIAFVLAAAAIAPIVAQPIHHEFAENDGHRPHNLHHHHHHHQRVAVPEKSSLEPTSEPVVHSKPQIVARGLPLPGFGGGVPPLPPRMPHFGPGPVITSIHRAHAHIKPGPQPQLGQGPASTRHRLVARGLLPGFGGGVHPVPRTTPPPFGPGHVITGTPHVHAQIPHFSQGHASARRRVVACGLLPGFDKGIHPVPSITPHFPPRHGPVRPWPGNAVFARGDIIRPPPPQTRMPHFGPGHVITGIPHVHAQMPHLSNEPASARHRVFSREYPEFDDMFERDLEDVDFDARDFDDELYLD